MYGEMFECCFWSMHMKCKWNETSITRRNSSFPRANMAAEYIVDTLHFYLHMVDTLATCSGQNSRSLFPFHSISFCFKSFKLLDHKICSCCKSNRMSKNVIGTSRWIVPSFQKLLIAFNQMSFHAKIIPSLSHSVRT